MAQWVFKGHNKEEPLLYSNYKPVLYIYNIVNKPKNGKLGGESQGKTLFYQCLKTKTKEPSNCY